MKEANTARVSKSLTETKKIAGNFLKKLEKNEDNATIISLSGNLGSGKTAFVKELATFFGIDKDEVTSPTFVIEKIYKLKLNKKNFSHLIHIDAYRLEKSKELLDLGWREIIGNPQNLIMIEWPEKVADIIPRWTIPLRFEFQNNKTRKIFS